MKAMPLRWDNHSTASILYRIVSLFVAGSITLPTISYTLEIVKLLFETQQQLSLLWVDG